MDGDEKKLELRAEYYPSIPRDELKIHCSQKLPLSSLMAGGQNLASLAGEIRRAIEKKPVGEGVYRCVFPTGVSGKLAEFTQEPGHYLGTILDDHGIAAQARWIPVDKAGVTIRIDPVSIALAAAMMNIDSKLDAIQKTQREILEFLHADKESQQEAAVSTLSDILEQYHFNGGRQSWQISQLGVVSSLKNQAEANMNFYRREAVRILDDTSWLHLDKDADEVKESLHRTFRYYRIAIYTHAFASFLQVVLSDNYSAEYLAHVREKIEQNSALYQQDFAKCSEGLEKYSRNSVETQLLSGLGSFGRFLGQTAAKIGVLTDNRVDATLLDAGRNAEAQSQKHADSVMRDFLTQSESGVQLFIDNIRTIDQVSNQPVELLFDAEFLYIR